MWHGRCGKGRAAESRPAAVCAGRQQVEHEKSRVDRDKVYQHAEPDRRGRPVHQGLEGKNRWGGGIFIIYLWLETSPF